MFDRILCVLFIIGFMTFVVNRNLLRHLRIVPSKGNDFHLSYMLLNSQPIANVDGTQETAVPKIVRIFLKIDLILSLTFFLKTFSCVFTSQLADRLSIITNGLNKRDKRLNLRADPTYIDFFGNNHVRESMT